MESRRTKDVVTLSELVSNPRIAVSARAIYENRCMVVMPVTKVLAEKSDSLFQTPARLDALALVLVDAGRVTISCNLNKVTVSKNCLFAIRPGSYIQVENVTDDCSASIVILDKGVLDRLNVSIQKIIPSLGEINEARCITLSQDEKTYIHQLFALIWHRIRMDREDDYYSETVESLLTSMVYSLLALGSRYVHGELDDKPKKGNREEFYFRRFLKLVQENFKQERKISFYAKEMCLSPKYLSGIIRNFSGKGPAEWIDDCVLTEARNLLKYSDKSIQEIANDLNFPTQSFFGRYFKAHTGYSPKAFRQL